jgi:hypothetical protein
LLRGLCSRRHHPPLERMSILAAAFRTSTALGVGINVALTRWIRRVVFVGTAAPGRPCGPSQRGPRAEAPAEGQKDRGCGGLRRLNLPGDHQPIRSQFHPRCDRLHSRPARKLHKGRVYAETSQAHRTRDQRGAPNGIFSDCEWERAAGLHSANQVPNEATGAEVPSHKLADHRKDGSRRSCDGNP